MPEGKKRLVSPEEAWAVSFTMLCEQYSEMGEQIKLIVAQHQRMGEILKVMSEAVTALVGPPGQERLRVILPPA